MANTSIDEYVALEWHGRGTCAACARQTIGREVASWLTDRGATEMVMSSHDPKDLSADQRVEEVASILARGVLRLHGRLIPHLSSVDQNLPETSPTGLDLSETARPHRSRAVNADENPKGGKAWA